MNERRHYAIGQSPTVYSEKSMFAGSHASEQDSVIRHIYSGEWCMACHAWYKLKASN